MIVMWRDSVIAHLSPFNCLFFSLQFEPPVNGQNPIVCGSMTRSVSDTYTLQKPHNLHSFPIRVTTFLLDVSVLQIIIFKINEPVLLSVQKCEKLANVYFVYGSVTRFSGVASRQCVISISCNCTPISQNQSLNLSVLQLYWPSLRM